MKLLVLGINRSPEPVGIAPYTTEMTRWLAARGHDVAMVSAQPYYPAWQVMQGWPKWRWTSTIEDGVSVTRCPLYIPGRPSGPRRIVHHASFAATALPPMMRRARAMRPDIVMAIAPSLLAAPAALLSARISGARTWLHVQDFEIDAAIATGLLSPNRRAARRAAGLERSLLHRFDRVSTISPKMGERLIQKGVAPDRVVEFRNWADIDAIRPLTRPSVYRDLWNIDTPYVALYSGNLANKQGIEIVVEAAHRLRERTDLTFVICGEGPSRARVATAIENLPNVQLHDLQPREALGDLLGLATVHLLPQMGDAADLVLPSKLTNILASGRPVVATSARDTGLSAEIEGCGIATPPGDVAAFVAGIAHFLDDPEARGMASEAARIRAEKHWSKDAILTRVEHQLEALIW